MSEVLVKAVYQGNERELNGKELRDVLSTGHRALIVRKSDGEILQRLHFRAAPEGKDGVGFWAHGLWLHTPMLDSVFDWLSGDAHDVSKLQWFDGYRFTDLVKDSNDFAQRAHRN